MRALRTVVSAQQALVHVLTALGRRTEVPTSAAERRAIVTARRIRASLVIAASWTDRALIYVHAKACAGVSLVSQSTRFRAPITIRFLRQERELDFTWRFRDVSQERARYSRGCL